MSWSSLIVQRIDPVVIVHGRVFDDITVRITASAADFEVDAGQQIVFGDRTVRPFTEDWTFQRSVGVITTQKARHPGEHLPELRRTGRAQSDRRVPLLQGGRHQRKVRLGGLAHRAG